MDQVLVDLDLAQERALQMNQMIQLQIGHELHVAIMFPHQNLVPPLMAQECQVGQIKSQDQVQVSTLMHLDGTGLVINQESNFLFHQQLLLVSHPSLVLQAPFPVVVLKKNQIVLLTGVAPNRQTKYLVQTAHHLVSQQAQEVQTDFHVIHRLEMSLTQLGTGHAISQRRVLAA